MSTTENNSNLAVAIAALLCILEMQKAQVVKTLRKEFQHSFCVEAPTGPFDEEKEVELYDFHRDDCGAPEEHGQSVNLRLINNLYEIVSKATAETVESISFLVLNKIWDFECYCEKQYNPTEVMDLYSQGFVELDFTEPCVAKEDQGFTVTCAGFCSED
jgi:hypothetical protein